MFYQFKKLIRYCLILIGISILFIFCYLRFGAYVITNKDKREEFFTDIRSAPQLPDNFLHIYKTLYPEALDDKGWSCVFNFYKQRESPSVELAVLYGQVRRHGSFGYFIQYNFMIEDHTTQEQCLNKILQVKDFSNNIIGIEEASKRYFSKALKKLNDAEILEIITRIKNPQLFNKERKPKIFEDRLNVLKNQLKKNINNVRY